jgi:hypothetical protein
MGKVKIVSYFKATNLIMRYAIYLIAIILFTSSCKSNEGDPAENQMSEFGQLQEQTLDLHDETMDKMGTLMDLSMEVEERMKSENLSEEMIGKLEAAKIEMDNTHGAMMDWMKDYSTKFPFEADAPETEAELEQQMPVLQNLSNDIKSVKSQTEKAIDDAKELLERTA